MSWPAGRLPVDGCICLRGSQDEKSIDGGIGRRQMGKLPRASTEAACGILTPSPQEVYHTSFPREWISGRTVCWAASRGGDVVPTSREDQWGGW